MYIYIEQMNKSLRRASAKKVREAHAPARKRLGPFCRRAATVGEVIVPTARRIETPRGQTTCVQARMHAGGSLC